MPCRLLAADPSAHVVLQGLVLDVGAGTLAVYANGSRLGTMVQPGMTCKQYRSPGCMTDKKGGPVAPLRPPLRWAVTVYNGSEVAIDGPQPLPGSAEFESLQQALQEEGQQAAERARKQEYEAATGGSSHNDEALPIGNVVWVGGISGRGTYQGFKRNTFGANEHTIRFDDSSTQTLKLKEQRWKYAR